MLIFASLPQVLHIHRSGPGVSGEAQGFRDRSVENQTIWNRGLPDLRLGTGGARLNEMDEESATLAGAARRFQNFDGDRFSAHRFK
jgi:hypothetical protein